MRVRAGDTDLFATLVQKHQHALLNFFRKLGVRTEGEDLVQECFVRVYKNRKRYEPRAAFTTFLYRVARTVWIDWVRRSARRSEAFEAYQEHLSTQSQHIENPNSGTIDMEYLLAQLPEKQRLVVVMKVCQGLKHEEIGAILRIPSGTVKSRLSTALQHLRTLVEQQEGLRS